MSTQHQNASLESEIADMEVKLVYRNREVSALLTKDFLESTVESVKLQIVHFQGLAPIKESINELALYLRLPKKQEGEPEFEELIEASKMSDYIDKLSYCLELRLQKREC